MIQEKQVTGTTGFAFFIAQAVFIGATDVIEMTCTTDTRQYFQSATGTGEGSTS